MKAFRRALALLLAASLVWPRALSAAELEAPKIDVQAVVPALPAAAPLLQIPVGAQVSAVPANVAPSALAGQQAQSFAVPAAKADAPAAQAKSAEDARWSGARPVEAAAAEPVAAAPSASPIPLSASLPGWPSEGGKVPAPRAALSRAGELAAWLGLTGLASLAHAPFDRVAPLVIGVVMSLGMSMMWGVFAGAMQSAVAAPVPAAPPAPPADPRVTAVNVKLNALAAEVGLPAPKRFTFVDSPVIQAKAGGPREDYEVQIYKGFLELPGDQQEGILRHELGHIAHADSFGHMAAVFLAPLAPSIALTAGILADWRGWLTLPFALAAVAGYGLAMKRHEYLADQFAAATQGSSGPMIRFFRGNAARDAAERAARPAPKNLVQRGLRAGQAYVDFVSRLWGDHPSHEKRAARLERLSR